MTPMALWWISYAWRFGYTPLLSTSEDYGRLLIRATDGDLCE
jgi:hypothetical protein